VHSRSEIFSTVRRKYPDERLFLQVNTRPYHAYATEVARARLKFHIHRGMVRPFEDDALLRREIERVENEGRQSRSYVRRR